MTETTIDREAVRRDAIVQVVEIRERIRECKRDLEAVGEMVDAAFPGVAEPEHDAPFYLPDDHPARDWAEAIDGLTNVAINSTDFILANLARLAEYDDD
jgi:hypothetical protein